MFPTAWYWNQSTVTHLHSPLAPDSRLTTRAFRGASFTHNYLPFSDVNIGILIQYFKTHQPKIDHFSTAPAFFGIVRDELSHRQHKIS
jgi:hypothetical protein